MDKTKIYTGWVRRLISLAVCLISLSTVASAAEHLRIEEQKLILKGHISKALGEYDSHLKGAVEYLVCGQNGKEYESIVVVTATAKQIYEALEKIGVAVGTPPGYDEQKDEPTPPQGTEFLMYVEWKVGDVADIVRSVRAEELIFNVKTQKPMQHVAWIYSGSRVVPDLDSEDPDAMMPQAFMSNDIVALKRFDASALFQNPLPESEEENIYKKNEALLPKLGTPVMLTIEVNRKVQVYVRISGKVQGVGFRNFTQRHAQRLGIYGYAKNLPTGEVEVVAEAAKSQVDAFIAVLMEGPRAARVDSLESDERPFTGDYKTFGIRY